MADPANCSFPTQLRVQGCLVTYEGLPSAYTGGINTSYSNLRWILQNVTNVTSTDCNDVLFSKEILFIFKVGNGLMGFYTSSQRK